MLSRCPLASSREIGIPSIYDSFPLPVLCCTGKPSTIFPSFLFRFFVFFLDSCSFLIVNFYPISTPFRTLSWISSAFPSIYYSSCSLTPSACFFFSSSIPYASWPSSPLPYTTDTSCSSRSSPWTHPLRHRPSPLCIRIRLDLTHPSYAICRSSSLLLGSQVKVRLQQFFLQILLTLDTKRHTTGKSSERKLLWMKIVMKLVFEIN